MKTKLFFATSLLLTAVAVSGGNRGTTPLTLRFNLPNGAKFAASTTMNMSMMVMQKDQGMNAVMSQAISVSKVGNGFKAVTSVLAKSDSPRNQRRIHPVRRAVSDYIPLRVHSHYSFLLF